MDNKLEAQQAWTSNAAQLPSDNEGLAYLKGIEDFKASLKEEIEKEFDFDIIRNGAEGNARFRYGLYKCLQLIDETKPKEK